MNYRNPDLLALASLAPRCMCCDRPNDGTVVPAHANSAAYGKGMGLKAHDWAFAAACAGCHAYIDQGVGARPTARGEWWMLGHRKTLAWLFAEGHLVVRPADYVEPVRAPKPKARVRKGRALPTGRKLQSNPEIKSRGFAPRLQESKS